MILCNNTTENLEVQKTVEVPQIEYIDACLHHLRSLDISTSL